MRDGLLERTKRYAMDIIRLTEELPRNRVADVLGRQLLRSGTAIGANYRAACRARSKADFINKMGMVEEETDESQYWLELLVHAKLIFAPQAQPLLAEADAILGMTVSSIRTARANK